MSQNIDKNSELKENLRIFFNRTKKKIILIFILILITTLIIFIWNKNQIKKNLIISEKYVEAGVALSNNKKDKAAEYYEEIIISKNKFYSLLAFNKIIENNLIQEENKILRYFEILENLKYKEDKKDLIQFKKALYLLKLNKTQEAKDLLENLIEKNSNLKNIAKEFI